MSTDPNAESLPLGDPVDGWIPPAPPSRSVMEGHWCRLEPLDPATHAEELFAANQLDRESLIWTYLPYGPFERYGDYVRWIEEVCASDDPLFFAIHDLGSGRTMGVASYLRIRPASGSIEVGHLNFSPLLQRTPAATEAMYLMMRHAFELGYRRYEWKCNALNTPSRIAAQRLGLSFEGIFRQHSVVKGRNRDTAWYAAIDSEWPELRRAFESWLDPANFDDEGGQVLRLSQLTAPLLKQTG